MNTLRIPRSEPLRIRLPAGGVVALRAITRDQVRRCLLLGPEKGATESARGADRRRAEEMAILAEGSALRLESLTAENEHQILNAVAAMNRGIDPGDTAALEALWNERQPRTQEQQLDAFDAETERLAVHLRVTLAAAESQPQLDSLRLLSALEKARFEQARWDASLHDKTVTS